MAAQNLHVLTASDSNRSGAIVPSSPPCRRPGCVSPAGAGLGFCPPCRGRYELSAARRGRLTDLICFRLAAVEDPLFALFGGRPRAFVAHVVAHLEETDATYVHVPKAAVRDYVDELDEGTRTNA